MKFRPLLLLLALVGAIGACGNPFATKATVKNIDDTATVFALTGAPQAGVTAVNTFVPTVVQADPAQHYDVVFDIRNGVAYALPPRAIGVALEAGLQKATQPFEAITQAPVNGYNDSLPVPIKAGDVILVQSLSYACTAQVLNDRRFIYSKIVIDSIFGDTATNPADTVTNPATQVDRTISFRIRVDPNCGFISFADGLPTF